MQSRNKFQKVKLEHHIIPEFAKFLLTLEKDENIKRIIPGRINRQQKSSSAMRFTVSYPTDSGLKCIMSKWATAQELFIICDQGSIPEIQKTIEKCKDKFIKK